MTARMMSLQERGGPRIENAAPQAGRRTATLAEIQLSALLYVLRLKDVDG
jgi:hypothetical protein